MSRLGPVARESLPEDQRRFHDAVRAIRRSPISGPFIVLMNAAPELAARFAHLGHYFHARGQADESVLPMRVRGFVSVIGSRALDAPYEWAAWVNWSLDAGVPQATVDESRERRPFTQLTDDDRLVLAFCSELVGGSHRLSDATWQSALARYGAQGVVELVVTLGYFAMIAMPLNAFEMAMTPEQLAKRRPFAPLPVDTPHWTPAAGPSQGHASPPTLATAAATRLAPRRQHADLPGPDQHYVDRIVRSRGQISPVFSALLHSPDVADRIACVGEFVLFQSALPRELRLTALLAAAREIDCGYIWSAYEPAARACLGAAAVDALAAGTVASALPARERAALTFCRQLLRGNHHVDAATYQATVDALGVSNTALVAATVGYGLMLGFIANACAVAPNPDASLPAL